MASVVENLVENLLWHLVWLCLFASLSGWQIPNSFFGSTFIDHHPFRGVPCTDGA